MYLGLKLCVWGMLDSDCSRSSVLGDFVSNWHCTLDRLLSAKCMGAQSHVSEVKLKLLESSSARWMTATPKQSTYDVIPDSEFMAAMVVGINFSHSS